ncbi:MAG TPA: hypothetical protein DCZ13_06515 [Porticoccaceae bacterium]|nr:hypothetical protein [Porticoccaceae bacterium]
MDLLQIAAKLFMDKLPDQGSGLSLSLVTSALEKLLPSANGDLDIAALVNQFMNQGGLAAMASSWLGDGGNQSLSADKLLTLLGGAKVGAFAEQLGLDQSAAASGLSEMIPELIDKSSSAGAVTANPLGALTSGLTGKLFN